MPVVLHPDMDELTLLRHVRETYAEPSNWQHYEREDVGRIVTMGPWANRDRGDYARRAGEFIKGKKA